MLKRCFWLYQMKIFNFSVHDKWIYYLPTSTWDSVYNYNLKRIRNSIAVITIWSVKETTIWSFTFLRYNSKHRTAMFIICRNAFFDLLQEHTFNQKNLRYFKVRSMHKSYTGGQSRMSFASAAILNLNTNKTSSN